MKKMNFFMRCAFLCVCIISFSFNSSLFAQEKSKMEKELEKKEAKEIKDRVKQWEKEGYKVANSTSTLEVALLKHKVKLQDDNSSEKEGVVSRCKSLNVGKQAALNNAQNALAQELVADIEGEVMSIMSQDEDDISEEQDKKTMTFMKNIKIDLTGVLSESFAICKKNADGRTYEYIGYYIVNEEKKNAAVNKAVNKSLTETDIALELADKIRNHLQKKQE